MACGLVVYALNHCATPLGNNLWKENTSKTILDFMVYFYGKYITIWRFMSAGQNCVGNKIEDTER